MGRHVLGIPLFILPFFLGYVGVPRVPIFTANGSLGNETCGARTFTSDRNENVTFWSCSVFRPDTSARYDLEFRSAFYTTIARTDSRTVGSYFTGDQTGYCILRLDGDFRNDICSMSLEAALEFEEQRFGLSR